MDYPLTQPVELERASAGGALRRETLGYLAMLLLAAAFLIGTTANSGLAAWSDEGGYRAMLRYFIASGRVDYMHWSQPTFVGVLFTVVPWIKAFGSSQQSLQNLGVLHGIALICGIYLFLTRYTRPGIACLLTLCLFLFGEFLRLIPAFMTDVYYLTYFVWFLLVHQRLETGHVSGASKKLTPLWIAWGGLFLLAGLTRSFIFILIPLFVAQALMFKDTQRQFAFRSVAGSLVVFALFYIITHAITYNGFKLIELTIAREVLVNHDWKRFELRTLFIVFLHICVISLPALLLSEGARLRKVSPVEAILSLVTLIAGVYFWRKGLLPAIFTIPSVPQIATLCLLLQIVVAPIGAVLIWRILCIVFREAVQTSHRSKTDEQLDRANVSTLQILLLTVAIHFAILPVMQHPMLRYVLPAYLALILLIGALGARWQRAPGYCAIGIVAVLCVYSAFSGQSERRVNAAVVRLADELYRSGKPLDDIYGGWTWFCLHSIRPGQLDSIGYMRRYADNQKAARFAVVEEDSNEASGRKLRSERVITPLGARTVSVFDRQPAQ